MFNPSATQSVECSIFSFLANSGLLKKLSIHSVCPWPNMGSKSSSTTAAVLGMSGVIRLDCGTVFLPVSTRIHHKGPVLDSHSSKVFIHWLSELLLSLLYAQYQSLGQQLIDVHWKHAARIPCVDSSLPIYSTDTRYLFWLASQQQKCQSTQRPRRRRGKYFKLQMQRS